MKVCFYQSFVLAILFTPLLLISVYISGAQVMTSTNFKIQSDSINIGGGFSSSTNYAVESTVGEIATGKSDSASYSLRAGYQQMQEIYIAISSSASSIALSPAIPGVTGGTSNGSTSVTVRTDNLAGYELTIQAEGSPAMQKGSDSISDYVPSTANPDYSFITGAADSHLGYTPEGNDVIQRFLDDGVNCNTGSGNTVSSCWDGLSTTAVPIASSATPNHPSGTETSIRFRVGIGGSVVQAVGTYTATTTLTALPL